MFAQLAVVISFDPFALIYTPSWIIRIALSIVNPCPSPFAEIAIHEIEKLGVPARNIVALPVENLKSETHIIDSIHRVDGRSILDGAMICATLFSVIGTIYGFVLYWGPIIWGLLGLIGGFFLGLATA
ncbi:hypothetical protein A8708_03415 [Paenibacillus oryzisoli]|uniref:Uncharacterized protein n=1 Tax=Paenibacillus oryzisoli TaxID=1850517 RepID=A0A198A3F4_9BACL|nr:hypothetical protein A8708_03415 [Paenibacillus oryzisoli]